MARRWSEPHENAHHVRPPWRPARGAREHDPGVRRALAAGATGLETDVWLSADGEVVCAHDPVVREGRGGARSPTPAAADLAEFGVPRLADVYDELGTAYECSVDVKSPDAAAALVDVGRRHDALERLWVCSPDLEVLRRTAARATR